MSTFKIVSGGQTITFIDNPFQLHTNSGQDLCVIMGGGRGTGPSRWKTTR